MKATYVWSFTFLLVGLLTAAVIGRPATDIARDLELLQRLGQEDAAPDQGYTPPTEQEIRDAARTIDDYIARYYDEHKVRPNAKAPDHVFLRRAYLDIVGRIPTVQETVDFMRSGSNKRSKLIDELLDSEGYVSHNFNYWADLLRVKTDAEGGIPWANWVKKALRKNKPFDQFAFEMLAAEGFPTENGAVGFYLRDDGMPLDNMALAVKTFMGTSLVCAQCHDHPFDLWTQMQFYEMAAYTYGVTTRDRAENVEKAQKMVKDRAVRNALDDITRPLTYGVKDTGRSIQLPHDYQYDDAKPNQRIAPAAIFNGKVKPAKEQTRRQAYARWMTSPQNPRFTTVIANRMWKKVMGFGLIEPVDEMTADSKARIPELMAFLEYKMRQYNYDLKQFQRMLFNTEFYQKAVIVEDSIEGETYNFEGPVLSRMSAEQFWDSIMTLIIPDPDLRPGKTYTEGYSRVASLAQATPEQLVEMAEKRAEYEMKQQELRNMIAQAREKKQDNKVRELQQELRELRNGSMSMMAMNSMSMSDNYSDGRPANNDARWNGYPDDFVRASELPSPTDPMHFLRLFGQSDRDIANNSTKESNMLQVLTMFNGGMFDRVMAPSSQLMKNVASVSNPGDKVQIIFLSIYNRKPTSYEKSVVMKAITTSKDHEYGRLIWALLNTREFSFVQ